MTAMRNAFRFGIGEIDMKKVLDFNKTVAKLVEEFPELQQALADGAKDGTDFPYIVHLSLPVPDFITNESRRSEALEIIINELKNIDASMDDVIIIACNTAHLL